MSAEDNYQHFITRLMRIAEVPQPSDLDTIGIYDTLVGKAAEFTAAVFFLAALQLIEEQRKELGELKAKGIKV